MLFLIAYALPILKPELSASVRDSCRAATWVTWGLFVLDYAARFALSEQRLKFVRSNLLDLAVVALPLLRPLRLLRLVTLLSVLNRYAGGSLRGRVAVYVVGATSMVLFVLFVSSLAILEAERDKPGATINTFGDALWWAMTTMTTVGYGDRYPVTGQGRFVAAGLMVAVIALLGVVTASFASWLLDQVRQVEEANQVATRRYVEALASQVAALRTELKAQTLAASASSHVRRDVGVAGLEAFVPASVEPADD